MLKIKVKCGNCKKENHVKKENVYQDIKGQFILCEKCNDFISVEMEG